MSSVKLLVRIAFDYSNVLRELALYGSLHSACIITPTFIKKSGVGASSVQPDDPSKDNDGNSHDNQPLRSKRSQEHRKNSNEAKSDKDSGKSKNTQTGSGKHRNKKLNTLGEICWPSNGRRSQTTHMYSGWYIKSSNR